MRIRKFLGGTSARRGFFALFFSTSFGSFLALVFSPVITRLFDPGNFGSFTVLTAMAMALTPLMSFRLELAVPLPKDERLSYALVYSGLATSLVLGGAFAVTFLFAGPSLGDLLGQEVVGRWLWTVPIMAAAMSSFSVLNALAIRSARYAAIARRNILMTVTTLSMQIAAGFLGYGVGGLVVGFAIGQVIGAASLLFGSGFRSPSAVSARDAQWVFSALSRYRSVPTVLTVAGVVSALGLQAPVLLIAHFYSDEVVGWFGLTQRVLAAPVTLIGLSVAQVYLSELAKSKRESTGCEKQQFMKASRLLFAVGIVLSVGLFSLGPPVFDLLFGSDWRPSGQYAQIMAFALAAQLIAAPLSQTLVVFERNRLLLGWDTARLIAVCAAITPSAAQGNSAPVTLLLLSGTLSVMYALQWYLSLRTLQKDRGDSSLPLP